MPKQGKLDLYAKHKNVRKGRVYVSYDFFNLYITPRAGQAMGMTQHKRDRMCSFPIRRVREALSYSGFREYARRLLAHANLSFPERSDLKPHFEAALGFISEQYQPRPYQIEAVKRMIEAYNKGKWGFILGDEPGTGKTIQAIMLAFAMFRLHYRMKRRDQWCILIVVPAALRDNFMREIHKADNGRGMIKFVVKDRVENAKICV
ncbi:MAG: SNF2-related protein, partial [Nitrososphaerota archaeon]